MSQPAAPHCGRPHRSNSSVQTPNIGHNSHDHVVHFFQYKTVDFLFDLRQCPPDRKYSETNFAQKLRDQWDQAKNRGAINYDLNCMYKLLEGDFNFSMQLNVERNTLRRKPMRFQSIIQPFNHHRWNFTKLKRDEILFYIRCMDRPVTDDPLDTHALCVNASPLERAHSLLIPSLSKCLPQIMNESGIRIATDFMLLVEDENFHVLYNSLLGQASVNHLHLHTIFWPYESDLIYRRFELLAGACFVIRRPNWFISTFAYQLRGGMEAMDDFVKVISRTMNFLTRRNVAHNLFFTRAPPIRIDGPLRDEQVNEKPLLVTAYIIPRRAHTGAKPMNNFNPAALELSGCLTAYTYRFFDAATEQIALRIFDEDAVLDDGVFEQLTDELAERLDGRVQWSAPVDVPTDVRSHVVGGPHVRRHTHAPYVHVESADSTVSAGGAEDYELQELVEELKDSFHAVSMPSRSYPYPLRHHHSFNLGSNANDDGPPAEIAAARRRTHTAEAATTFAETPQDSDESDRKEEEAPEKVNRVERPEQERHSVTVEQSEARRSEANRYKEVEREEIADRVMKAKHWRESKAAQEAEECRDRLREAKFLKDGGKEANLCETDRTTEGIDDEKRADPKAER